MSTSALILMATMNPTMVQVWISFYTGVFFWVKASFFTLSIGPMSMTWIFLFATVSSLIFTTFHTQHMRSLTTTSFA